MSDDTAAISKVPTAEENLAEFLFYGNLDSLTMAQRSAYMIALCKHMDLDPASKPFDLIVLNGKLTVYANKGAAAQLQVKRKISLEVLYAGPLRMGHKDGQPLYNNEVYVVEVVTRDANRTSTNAGAVSIKGLSGEALANAIMKTHTKASRRAVLQHAGLGFPDESEIETIPNRSVVINEPGGITRILPGSEAPRKV